MNFQSLLEQLLESKQKNEEIGFGPMNVNQVFSHLDQMKKLYESTQHRKGKEAPKISNHQLLMSHRMQRRSMINESGSLGPRVMNTSIFDVHHSQVSDLTTLKPILIDELKLETCHKGRYLLCRTVEDPYKIHAVMSIVEDGKGRYALLSLYNYAKSINSDAGKLVPANTVLLIKEPYFKSTSNDGAMLRCDSPSDVVVINYLDENYQHFKVASIRNWGDLMKSKDLVYATPIPESPIKWKDRGNNLYQKSLLDDAIRAYTLGLSLCDLNSSSKEDYILLTLNRSAAFMMLGKFEDCIKDALNVLELSPGNVKALSRAARSYYQLRLYDSALKYYEELFKHDSSSLDGLSDCRKRIKEQTSGYYDWKSLWAQVKKTPGDAVRLDIGDYFNADLVETRFISKAKGRGVFAKKDISPGTLLSVEKAFQVSFASEVENLFLTQIHFKNFTSYSTTHVQVCTSIMHALMENPLISRKAISGLCAGSDYKVNGGEEENMLNLMSFDRIRSVCFYNCFSTDEILNQRNKKLTTIDGPFEDKKRQGETEQICKGSGVWVKNSAFNHSCLSNAFYWLLGDVMVISASGCIRAGEEITVPYVSGEEDIEKRRQVCQKFGFTCDCELCRMDAKFDSSSFQKELNKFQTDLDHRIRQLDFKVVPQLKKSLDTMKAIYRRSSQTRFLFRMADNMSGLALLLQAQGRISESVKVYEEIFRNYCNIENVTEYMEGRYLGKPVFLTHNLLLVVQQIIHGYECLSNRKEIVRWTELLDLFNKIIGVTGIGF